MIVIYAYASIEMYLTYLKPIFYFFFQKTNHLKENQDLCECECGEVF